MIERKCNVPGCNRDGLTERELEVHKKYFHGKQSMVYEQPQIEPKPDIVGKISQRPQENFQLWGYLTALAILFWITGWSAPRARSNNISGGNNKNVGRKLDSRGTQQ